MKTKILKIIITVLLVIIAAINVVLLITMISSKSRVPIAQMLQYIPQSDIENLKSAQKEYEIVQAKTSQERMVLEAKKDSCLKINYNTFDRDFMLKKYELRSKEILLDELYAKVGYNMCMLLILVWVFGSLISIEFILFGLVSLCKSLC